MTQVFDAPLHVEIHVELLLLARQEMLSRVHLGQDALVEARDLVDQRHLQMQSWLEIRILDLTTGRQDGQLTLSDGEHARAYHQDHGNDGQQNVQQTILHQRDPRARAGSSTGTTVISGIRAGATVNVSLGIDIDCGPGAINLSSGRYIMLLLFFVSTNTLREFRYTFSIASRYMRSLVTAGACSYCAST